jgi:hypothetical protein
LEQGEASVDPDELGEILDKPLELPIMKVDSNFDGVRHAQDNVVDGLAEPNRVPKIGARHPVPEPQAHDVVVELVNGTQHPTNTSDLIRSLDHLDAPQRPERDEAGDVETTGRYAPERSDGALQPLGQRFATRRRGRLDGEAL